MTRTLLFILILFPLVPIQAQKSKDQKRFEKKKEYGAIWKQQDYEITVETDFEYLKMGQYLNIISNIGSSKTDLPESWKVNKAFATDSSFVLEIKDHKKFETSRYFMSKLDREILRSSPNIGRLDEEKLVAIWEKYNGKF